VTELERELIATLQTTRQQELQTVAELTAAVKQMSLVLTTFAEALMDMAYTNRQVEERSREIFRTLRQNIEN
jgi:ParB-like chromosome segregation protein Spo0J